MTVHLLKRLAASLACCICAGAHAQLIPGPGTWSGNQTWAVDTVNGGNLTGYYYWPASPPALGGKRALVIVLHGCAQTAGGDVIASGADQGFNWKAAADQYGALIVAPNATGNISGNHCWNYSNTNHSRSAGHDGVLLELVNRFVGIPEYAIDPKQVYVTGLSSGGGETMVLGCLAPDIFAGIGINAGPPPGTTTSQISFVPSGYTATTAANNCKALAGANAAHFATQISSVIWGSNDFTVAQAYGPLDAAAMRGAYGGTFSAGATVSVPGGGTDTPYLDANGKLRSSQIAVAGMGHAWPAGSGGQNGNFVDPNRVDYPAFLMQFWFAHNLRVNAIAAPVMSACHASVDGNTGTISGAATDAGGTISSYRVVLSGPTAVDDPAAGNGASFSAAYALANGYYTGSVTAHDAGTGQHSAACPIGQFLVGPAPVLQPPTGLAVSASSAHEVSLVWNALSAATGYHVYRNGSKVTGAPVAAPALIDGGLAPSSSYSYQASSVAGGGSESALSAPVTATTKPAFTCSATRSSNYAHVQAGRAYHSGGYARATGSGQNMGLNSIFYLTTLAQTAAGYYVIGHCP